MCENLHDHANGPHLLHRDLTDKILGSFYQVYRELGGGFAESIYELSLTEELERIDLRPARQVSIPVQFRGNQVGLFRTDILVNDAVLLELKARKTIEPIHESQLLNCLRATSIEVGLILNFGPEPQFKRFVYSNTRKRRSR